MGATRTLAADSAGDAMEATAAGMEEIELRTKDPLRMYRIWRKVKARALGGATCDLCRLLKRCGKPCTKFGCTHASYDFLSVPRPEKLQFLYYQPVHGSCEKLVCGDA